MSLTVSLLFHHHTLTNKLDWQYFSLVCQPLHPSIHPSSHPSIHPSLFPSPPLTPTIPGAMLCLLKRCVVSECTACHQYGWVTEVAGSNAVHRFTPSLAVPLPVQIMCSGVSERVSVCVCVFGMDMCVHMCEYLTVWWWVFFPLLCLGPCMDMYVCVSS